MAQIDPNTIQWDAPPQPVGKPVTGAANEPLRGGVILPGKPEKPNLPSPTRETEKWRPATVEEKQRYGVDPARAYLINDAGDMKEVSGQPAAKSPVAADPNRIMKLNTALDQIESLREISNRSLSTGVTAGKIKNAPIIGFFVGQNRADLEGGLATLEGQIIQDQLTELAKINPGGIASLANAESEARRLASSIANLDPNQSQEKFLEGLKRAEDYFKSQLTISGGERKAKPAATGGGQEGPTVSVTPEASIQAFGDYTGGKPGYDAQGNIVGLDYAVAGNTVYDESGKPLNLPLMGRVTEEAVQTAAPSFYEGLVQSVTGEDKATTATETLPDWVEMPELQKLFSMPSMKVGLSTALGGGPQEIAQIVQSNFPDTKVFQDEKGNYILQSPSTGQRYAIKPGFQLSDVPRALSILLSGGIGGGGAGATALRTGLREAGMQTGIEALQSAAGGTFNPADILAAGAMGSGGQKLVEVLPGAVQAVRGMRSGNVPTRVAATTDEFAMPAPGGIPMPGGRVTPAPAVPTTVATEEVATAGPRTFEAGETVSGTGGLSAAPTAGLRPLRFDVAPTEVLERSSTRAKPGVGVLDDASISDRERVLDALGLPPENRRLGAITGNKSQIEDEVMVSKLGEGSERMQQQFDLESRHLGEYALDLIDRTGGTLNLPPVQRGVAIVKPLEDYQNWYNGRIRELYRQADTAAAEAGVPITLQGLDDALKVNSTFGGKSALTTLRKGVRQKLQEQGAIGPKGELLPIDTRTAETIRQYLNDQWSPETNRVIGMLKGKIDDDVLSTLPTDVYAEARQMRRNYANIFEEPKGMAQLLDISGPDGINRKISHEEIGKKLANLAAKDSAQFNFVINALENMPTPELQQAGRQAVAEIRADLLESILKKNVDFEDISQGGDAMWTGTDKSIGNAIIPFKGKLSNIFGPEIAQRLDTLRVGARILRPVDPNPSGTATASQRLVGKTREALLRTGGGLIGTGVGAFTSNPVIIGAAGIAGERAGAKMVQRAEIAARERAIASSLDNAAKAKKLNKMRSRSAQQ